MSDNLKYAEADEINLNEIFTIILRGKYILITITFLAAIFSVVFSLSIPNKYASQALLAQSELNNSLKSQLGSMSSLAGLAGVKLSSETSKTSEAIERIKSFDFFTKYFLPNIRLENLLAVEKWIIDENTIIYNHNIYDERTNEWTRKREPNVPSNQEAFKEYKKIMSISQDNRTGFVSISITHQSPFIAREWVKLIINSINTSMRKESDDMATKSIEFLNNQASTTTIKETKDAIYQLVLSQMQNLMTSAATENYVFRIIDSPIAPEKKISPSRALICIIGTLIGGFIGVLLIFILHYRKVSNEYRN
jgi:LPS O-antigen subunit length determinant protein (WzzB/FepE family)